MVSYVLYIVILSVLSVIFVFYLVREVRLARRQSHQMDWLTLLSLAREQMRRGERINPSVVRGVAAGLAQHIEILIAREDETLSDQATSVLNDLIRDFSGTEMQNRLEVLRSKLVFLIGGESEKIQSLLYIADLVRTEDLAFIEKAAQESKKDSPLWRAAEIARRRMEGKTLVF